ncbi:MAG: ferredoxin family protein [Desulfobacteraceae bacterium]|jgi:adenylylsulfate reductase subunit B
MSVRLPIKIDYTKCIACGNCYNICPLDVYTWDEEKQLPVPTYIMECWFCGACMMDCPNRAIDIQYPLASW